MHDILLCVSGALQALPVILASAISVWPGCIARGVQGGGCGLRRPVRGPLLWPAGSSNLAVYIESPSDRPALCLPLFLFVLPDLRDASSLWYHGVSAAKSNQGP